MLSKLGYEVHSIIIEDFVDYEVEGKLLNLGAICKKDISLFRKIKKGLLIKKYIKENTIGIVIDNRSRPTVFREFFAKWTFGTAKIIDMVHISKVELYLSKSVFFAQKLYQNSAKIVCVSKAIEALVNEKYHLKNTQTIYNPVAITSYNSEKPAALPNNYFMFFGRLDEKQKNFALMLEAFKMSKVYEKGFHLVILGNGPDKRFIENKISDLNLSEFIQMIPFQESVAPYVEHGRASVLTSNYEGFPMSIIESLAIGTPVIAVDCPTGPSEIITNKYNGLLIENSSVADFSNAFSSFVDHDELFLTCKSNSQKSIEHLSFETIAQQWHQLLSSL